MSHNKEDRIFDEEEKEKCIILDLEGTITDCAHRIHYYHSMNYGPWNSLFSDDSVNEKFMDHFIKTHKPSDKIFIVTAKSGERKTEVEHWLKDHFFDFNNVVKNQIWNMIDEIFYRKKNDDRSSVDVKKELVIEILKEYDIIHAFDDRDDICRMYRQLGIETTLVNDHTMKMLSEPDIVQERLNETSEYMEMIESVRVNKEVKPGDVITDKDITPGVPEYLRQSARTFEERNETYGDSYKSFGNVALSFFPEGLELKTEEDFKRYGLLTMMLSKLHRYCGSFTTGGHSDSLIDLSTYSAMLNEVDHD